MSFREGVPFPFYNQNTIVRKKLHWLRASRPIEQNMMCELNTSMVCHAVFSPAFAGILGHLFIFWAHPISLAFGIPPFIVPLEERTLPSIKLRTTSL